MAKKQVIKIKDPEVLQYLRTLKAMGQADPQNASQYFAQAMGVYTSYLDSQKPENRLAKIFGEDMAPALSRTGLNVDAITDPRYTDAVSPLISQFMTLRNKYVQDQADENDVKKMTALSGLLNNPSKISEYQYYTPGESDMQSVIDATPWRKALQTAGRTVQRGSARIPFNFADIPGMLGTYLAGAATQGFAKPSELEMKNRAFSDTIGDIGNINPLQ